MRSQRVARSKLPAIEAHLDEQLRQRSLVPRIWAGVSNGCVPAAALACARGGAGLLLMSGAPAHQQLLPNMPVWASVGWYECYWGGSRGAWARRMFCLILSICPCSVLFASLLLSSVSVRYRIVMSRMLVLRAPVELLHMTWMCMCSAHNSSLG